MAAALFALALAAGCSGGDGDDAAPTTVSAVRATTPERTTSPTTRPDDATCGVRGSSPTTFDDASGTHAAYVKALDIGARRLTFDVVRWLVGQDAADAYHRETPDDPEGPPNDYFITNDSPRLRSATVTTDVAVRLLTPAGGATLVRSSWDELGESASRDGDFLTRSQFWLTMRDAQVVAICQQYVP